MYEAEREDRVFERARVYMRNAVAVALHFDLRRKPGELDLALDLRQRQPQIEVSRSGTKQRQRKHSQAETE
jgi:hypothetical protein